MTTLQISTPARLHHLHIGSPKARELAGFYADTLECTHAVEGGLHMLAGRDRALLISDAAERAQRYAAYALRDEFDLESLRARLHGRSVRCEPLDDPYLRHGAFLVADPQGRRIAFGVPAISPILGSLPGRLQHTVFQTTALEQVVRFYVDMIGFTVSDEVIDDAGALAVVFLRSDDEHHSLAFFRGSRNEWDHHCYETSGWNDLRDWGDRFAAAHIPIFFGPGRHGPGNNLFFMVTDPDGNRLEFSAELQTVDADAAPGIWPHAERTLNTWGRAWVRT
ncbi:glyoxalase-like domain protein [Burkholderia pseudomallei]|uniref:VOC family protein n=1 Tax=Burkholderia pseudomallei TaxID=28450 RepID=UPI00052A142A|nr:VOC family protein [Burkholderia pseudomallei]AIV75349.1 glyoxalase-like domain protein [Burkholderia pseudomallei]